MTNMEKAVIAIVVFCAAGAFITAILAVIGLGVLL